MGRLEGGVGGDLSRLCMDFALSHNRNLTGSAEIERLDHSIRLQLDAMLDHLSRNSSLMSRRLDLDFSDSTTLCLEINAFRIESQDLEGRPGESLYIGIIRTVNKQERRPLFEGGDGDVLRAVLDQAGDGLMMVDPLGFISYASPGVEALLGHTLEELVDRPIGLFLPRAAYLLSNIQSPTDRREEFVEVDRPGHEPIWLSVSARAIDLPGAAGEERPGVGIQSSLISLRDISEGRRRYETLRRENAALESYVHSVSHDLRTPLVSLLGFTRLLRQDFGKLLNESGRHFLSRIEQAGNSMEFLIRDLLELSRVERAGVAPAPVDPRNVLLQIFAELKPRLDEAGIDLKLPALPPVIHCHRTQLYQIFSNLIGNAIQHMGDCAVREIRVEIHERPGQHVIVVRDRGVGIPEASRERIFEAFHTVGKGSGPESTGIGLAIVKKIALAHEGRVWVESKPGHGSAFHVSLPAS